MTFISQQLSEIGKLMTQAMISPKIELEAKVTLHFSLSLESGDLIDSNFADEPATFTLGDGSMLPGFEETLMGCEPGSEFTLSLQADKAFGEINPRNVHWFPAKKFKDIFSDPAIATEVGSIVSFKDPGGGELPGVITKINKRSVMVDFNHPLAGKVIVFSAKVLSVIPPNVNVVHIGN
ncbi:MAG: peptidylprolyl isomerase [Gammaproteobacteria bacterium]|nr:peptidylprolyl isomerase [Gammaproteobacteria bacterium]